MKVVSLLEIYVEKVASMARKAEEALGFAERLEFDKVRVSVAEVVKLDTEADRFRREIVERYLPTVEDVSVRESVRVLIRMLDHVSEWIKTGLRYFDLIPLMSIPSDLRNSIATLFKLVRNGAEVLRDSLRLLGAMRFDDVYRYGARIEEIEEKADTVLHEAQRKIVELADKMDNVVYVLFVNELLKSLEIATDYEEDAGDVLRSLSLLLSRHSPL